MDAIKGIASSFSKEEMLEAQQLEEKIQEVTRTIIAQKKSIENNFVRLSQLINEVRQKKYWLLGNYKTFGDYLDECEKRFGVGHSQLYVGMKVVRNLLPTVKEEDLVEIGITKAGILSKYVEQSGQSEIPLSLLELAKHPETNSERLDAEVNSILHNVTSEKGKWFSVPGFFCTEDERQEILDALELAGNIDPLVPRNIPAWQQTKEKMLRMAREFLGSYS